MKKSWMFLLLCLLLPAALSAQDVIRKNDLYIQRSTGNPYTGLFREYDVENRLVSETSIKEGILDGQSLIYYPTGLKKEARVYKNGQKDGTWTSWNEDGKIIAEAHFREGKKDGYWYIWDDRGVKRYEMFYTNGEKTGTWTVWNEQGNIVSREEIK